MNFASRYCIHMIRKCHSQNFLSITRSFSVEAAIRPWSINWKATTSFCKLWQLEFSNDTIPLQEITLEGFKEQKLNAMKIGHNRPPTDTPTEEMDLYSNRVCCMGFYCRNQFPHILNQNLRTRRWSEHFGKSILNSCIVYASDVASTKPMRSRTWWLINRIKSYSIISLQQKTISKEVAIGKL